MSNELSMAKLIGKGYSKAWWTNNPSRYRLFKGGRNTKKSYVMLGLEVINKIVTQPYRNVMVVRQTETSHKITTWNTIIGAIRQPDYRNPDISLSRYFKINSVDKIITYIPTGQMIVFRGFDNADKLTGLRALTGYFTDVYIEEAFEIKSYDEFRKLDGSLRGRLPEGYFYQITFLFNAWKKEHWLYDVFFKGRLEDDYNLLEANDYIDYYDSEYIGDYGKGLYLHISTYKINEFRDGIYDVAMENLREKAPEIYKVEALGMWGVTGELVYPEWNDSCIAEPQKVMATRFRRYAIGIDTGLSAAKLNKDQVKSATTMIMSGLTWDRKKIIAIDEYFHSNSKVKKTEPEIMAEIIETLKLWQEKYRNHPDLMKGQVLVYVESADIGFKDGLQLLAHKNGLINFIFQPSTKYGVEKRVYFIRTLMAYGDYLVSSLCPNLIREHRTATSGEKGEVRAGNDHAQDGCEYGWASFVNELQLWATIKL